MSRHLVTVTTAAAGLAWIAGQALLPDMGLEAADRYDRVAEAPGLESVSGGLLVVAGALLVLTAVASAGRVAAFRGARGARTVTAGVWLLALGGVWLVGGRGAFNLMFVRLVEPDHVDRADALRLLDAGAGPGFVPLLLTLPCLLLGPVVLALGLRRLGAAGWAPLAGWVLGIVGFVGSEFTSKPGEVLGIGLAACSLVWMARCIDRSRDVTGDRHLSADSAGVAH